MIKKPSFSLKDKLFNRTSVSQLASMIHSAHNAFPSDKFINHSCARFPALQLKQRIAHITDTLHDTLQLPFPQAVDVILASLPAPLDPSKSDDDFGDFIFSPLSLYVAKYGCSAEHLQLSFRALTQLTQRFSAEFAMRFFLDRFPNESLAFLLECAASKESYHVRRLASEASRPNLPWAGKLANVECRQPLPILDKLFCDSTRFVTRSVANHMNDLSKIDAELTLSVLKKWKASGKQPNSAEMDFIVSHSLRTLKDTHAGAREMLGFDSNPAIEVSELSGAPRKLKIGEAFEFSFSIKSKRRQKLMVDYVVDFRSSNAKKRQKKRQIVFRIAKLEMKSNETKKIAKKHHMRLTTTRKLYAGEHKVTLIVNGKNFGELKFELIDD